MRAGSHNNEQASGAKSDPSSSTNPKRIRSRRVKEEFEGVYDRIANVTDEKRNSDMNDGYRI